MTTQTKVSIRNREIVLKELEQSMGSDWSCYFEGGSLEYKPALIYSIDFKALERTGEKSVKCHGVIMYGPKKLGKVDIWFSETKLGTISIVLSGDINQKLEGVSSKEKPEEFDLGLICSA